MVTDTTNEVLILGAGFSKAIDCSFPLADDLGQKAYDRAKKLDSGLFDRSFRPTDRYPFEVWLSLLAQEQPHLDEAANRKNAAQFASLADAAVAVLEEVQERALARKPPTWFYELLSVLHARKSTVITFNYDTLVEVGINSMHIALLATPVLPLQTLDVTVYGRTHNTAPRITSDDILLGSPGVATTGFPDTAPLNPTLRLLKLHGSLDWWWVPRDQSGATFAREQTRGSFGHPARLTMEQRSLALPGREPFIVPPLAVKSGYYANPVTKQLWRDAYAALRQAKCVTFVGYSLPQTDTVTGGMLASALQHSAARVQIVDPNAHEVAERLQTLWQHDEKTGQLHTFECIESYVRSLLRQQSGEIGEEIGKLKPIVRSAAPDPAFVIWSRKGSYNRWCVKQIETTSEGVTTLCTEDGPVNQASDAFDGRPTTQDVISAAARATRLMVRAPNQQEASIIDFDAPNFNDPNARHVLYLIAAGQLSG